MFKKENMQIWRESLKAILFITLLLYIFKGITSADIYHGLIFPEDVYEQLPKVINNVRISIIESRDFLTTNPNPLSQTNPLMSMVMIIITPILSLLWSGLFVQYYRRITKGEDITIKGVFVLFEHNFLRNSLTVVLINLVTMLGLLLLIIPGLVLSLGLYPWALIASERENDDKTSADLMKMAWEVSKGNKGFFLLTILKWRIISIVVQAILIGTSYFLFYPGSLAVMIIISIMSHLVTSVFQGPPDIEIAQRLVYNNDLPYGKRRDELEENYIEVEIENPRDEDNFDL